jgi:cytochrome b subunit of formate dehydrogenase
MSGKDWLYQCLSNRIFDEGDHPWTFVIFQITAKKRQIEEVGPFKLVLHKAATLIQHVYIIDIAISGIGELLSGA